MAALKKVKMLTSGPNKNHKPGEILVVDEERAKRLIAGEHAEEVTSGYRVRIQKQQSL